MLTTTTFADCTDRSTPTCGGSVVPAAGCGPSSPSATVAELQARLSTLTPAIDCSEVAYASAERWQALSVPGRLRERGVADAGRGGVADHDHVGVRPLRADRAGTGARLAVPTRSDSEVTEPS